jgi:hypothetical protein
MTTPTPIGPHEVSLILGVNRQRVLQLMSTYADDFPEPWVHLKTGKIWRDTDIVKWAKAHGRTVHDWR